MHIPTMEPEPTQKPATDPQLRERSVPLSLPSVLSVPEPVPNDQSVLEKELINLPVMEQ